MVNNRQRIVIKQGYNGFRSLMNKSAVRNDLKKPGEEPDSKQNQPFAGDAGWWNYKP